MAAWLIALLLTAPGAGAPQAAPHMQTLVATESMSVPMSRMPGAEPNIELAQAMGFTCTTQFGSCPIPPQPVGSVCYCGATAGVTQ